MQVSDRKLNGLYAASDDPWNFATSHYEQEKFVSTKAALGRPFYKAALEMGCGNGELARHLAPLCTRYTGLDAVETALAPARRTVPTATFVHGYYPCPLPHGDYDLVILSEFLYFLSPREVRLLGRDIQTRWPGAELICVNYLGETEHHLQGVDALWAFAAVMADTHIFGMKRRTRGYRIDCGLPKDPS